MFKNKTENGKNNICGKKIAALRKAAVPKMSQRILADKMQLLGVDISQPLISKIEQNKRFVKDYELVCLCKVLNVTERDLLSDFYAQSD